MIIEYIIVFVLVRIHYAAGKNINNRMSKFLNIISGVFRKSVNRSFLSFRRRYDDAADDN